MSIYSEWECPKCQNDWEEEGFGDIQCPACLSKFETECDESDDNVMIWITKEIID